MNFNPNDFDGLSPEVRRRIASMFSQGVEPGQFLAGAGDIYEAATRAPAGQMQSSLIKGTRNLPQWAGGGRNGYLPLHRMAGSKNMTKLLRGGAALGAVGGALGAVDLVTGEESLANKAMDATAMGIGGVLGMAGGPMGAAGGAGLGKAISDGTQWLFGDKKTPQQRELEQALINLQGGRF